MAAKSTTLELTIADTYVPNWGLWESVREIAQNAADARDMGASIEIAWVSRNEGQLTITTKGATIGRETLLLGATTKAHDSNQRGQFGEGYKLALLALLRAGHEVWIRTGAERWIPEIRHSAAFGTELLAISIAPLSPRNETTFRVRGVSREQWSEIQARLPCIAGDDTRTTVAEAPGGKILDPLGETPALYVKGIYVSPLEGYTYSYDLDHCTLDRDRSLADPWSLAREIVWVLESAAPTLGTKKVWDLLTQNSEESQAIAKRCQYDDLPHLENAIATEWQTRYGNTLAVASQADVCLAGQHGFTAMVAPPAVVFLVEKAQGATLKDKVAKRSTEAKATYTCDDLSLEELETYMWAVETVQRVEPNTTYDSVSVVDFCGPILGTYNTGSGAIRLARGILCSRAAVMAVLIHEAAHAYGRDGEASHREAIERIAGEIIAAK